MADKPRNAVLEHARIRTIFGRYQPCEGCGEPTTIPAHGTRIHVCTGSFECDDTYFTGQLPEAYAEHRRNHHPI